MSDAIAFCFPVVAEGTALAGAELDIRHIDGRAKCHDCATRIPHRHPIYSLSLRLAAKHAHPRARN